jgi:Cof subfamily protein (haloacid dehalogenase superfamily)
MKEIKLIAFDLDYTLLNDDKEVSERNMRALALAAEKGIHIVPATGRFYGGIPKCIKDMDFIRYVISINGACVFDLKENKEIFKAEIPRVTALELIKFTERYPVAFDCYMDNVSYMNKAFIAEAEKYAPDRYYLEMFKNLRVPVEDIKQLIEKSDSDVQKVQWFITDMGEKDGYMKEIADAFPEFMVSSSVPKNIEINIKNANKGEALLALAGQLSIPAENTAAFGDGSNDITMIRLAGTGIAMGNAIDGVKEAADFITLPYYEDGVAYGIEKICGVTAG